ncbi:MAG: hypothetical protein LQ341_005215, partial [Variospora aurantia]
MPMKLRPKPADLDISRNFENVNRRNIGGNGCFNAGVFIVRHKRSRNKYVEKKYSPENIIDGTGSAEFEMFVLRELPHPNIVKYMHGFIDEHSHRLPIASIYMEYCDKGNLQDLIQKLRAPLGEEAVWDLSMQLVNAVAFMQYGVRDACRKTGVPEGWIGVVHRDIKPDNVFLCSIPGSSRLRLVLGDFGQAIRQDDDGNWGRQYLCGNRNTAPPEVQRYGFEQYSYAGDVWSVGWCMSSLCIGSTDYDRVMDYRQMGGIYSRSIDRAIRCLMQVDAMNRPLMFDFAAVMPTLRDEGLAEGKHMRGRYAWVLGTMCGIIAVAKLAGSSSQSHANGHLNSNGVSYPHDPHWTHLEKQLDRSLAAIDHRGPDSHGAWFSDDGNIGLGSCRLEINGLGPGGQQPFGSSDGTIHAVVNGELYDHQRIRADMALRSRYQFKGGSDSEIVMALYEYYGLSFLSHLRGEFALCLYDANKQLLLAARDRSGTKPLFWTVDNGRLLLASEAKALLPFGWRPEWDVRSIIDKGWLTEERTIFKRLRKIRPGSYLTCLSLDHITEAQYWDHDYPDKKILETRTEEEMIEGVRSRMLDAIRIRLQADVPVGIHLSGGIDSAVIAGMAKHLLDRGEVKLGSSGSDHLRCLGIAFDKDSGFDESKVVIAQNTANFLDVDFQKTHMDEAALAANFEEATWFDEQPHFDLGFVGKHVLSKLTRDSGLKTVLSGQGSDEIFGGYDVFLQDYLREPDQAWPNNDLSEPLRLQKLQE